MEREGERGGMERSEIGEKGRWGARGWGEKGGRIVGGEGIEIDERKGRRGDCGAHTFGKCLCLLSTHRSNFTIGEGGNFVLSLIKKTPCQPR